MIGSSPAFFDMQRRATACACVDAPILLCGESGSGKKTLARDIHAASGRAAAPFIAVNCGSFDYAFFERFFSDCEQRSAAASNRSGEPPVAGGGTIYLAEIEALSPAWQIRLLDMLTGLRAPAARRLIAATDHDLFARVRDGRFRMDLYQYFSRVTLSVPPLRARGNDVLELAQSFLLNRNFRKSVQKLLEPDAMIAMRAYAWPGNVRELRNAVERGVILSGEEPAIQEKHLGIHAGDEADGLMRFSFLHFPTMDELQRHYIRILLDRKDFSRARIAATLNISERTVYRILRDLEPVRDAMLVGQEKIS